MCVFVWLIYYVSKTRRQYSLLQVYIWILQRWGFWFLLYIKFRFYSPGWRINKCIRFCLRLDKIQHISLADFRSINWMSTKERVHQCINAITFNFLNKSCTFYLNEIFEFAPNCKIDSRNCLQSVSTLLARLTRSRKPYRTLVALLETIYPKPLKKTQII